MNKKEELNNIDGGLLENSKRKLLSKEETYWLIKDYQNNQSIKSRNKIIDHNIGLLHKIAYKTYKHYKPKMITPDELISEGMTGMIKAIDRFDLARDMAFSTYAYLWIQQAMQRYILGADNLIYIPTHSHKDELDDRRNRQQGNASSTNLRIIDTKNAKFATDSINQTDKDDMPLVVLKDKDSNVEEQYMNHQIENNIDQLLSLLNEREKDIIKHRYALGDYDQLTLEGLASKHNITRERIRQLQLCAIRKLTLLVIESSEDYGRKYNTKLAQKLYTGKTILLEKKVISIYGDVKDYLLTSYEEDMTYDDISKEIKYDHFEVRALAYKYQVSYADWIKNKKAG